MGGFDHGPDLSDESRPDDTQSVATSARNAKVGMRLFLIYLTLYGGFVLANAFRPETMDVLAFAGINLAVVYGFGLIVAALLLALIYGWICRVPADAEPARKERA